MLDSDAAASPHSPQLVALSRSECLSLLSAGNFGRVIVTVGADHRPLIRPVNYMFEHASQSVTFRTAAGTKLHALLRSTSTCFEVDHTDADTGTGWSVIIYGISEQVVHPTEIRRLERSGLNSLAPGPRPDWIRVRATTITGMRIGPLPAIK